MCTQQALDMLTALFSEIDVNDVCTALLRSMAFLFTQCYLLEIMDPFLGPVLDGVIQDWPEDGLSFCEQCYTSHVRLSSFGYTEAGRLQCLTYS